MVYTKIYISAARVNSEVFNWIINDLPTKLSAKHTSVNGRANMHATSDICEIILSTQCVDSIISHMSIVIDPYPAVHTTRKPTWNVRRFSLLQGQIVVPRDNMTLEKYVPGNSFEKKNELALALAFAFTPVCYDHDKTVCLIISTRIRARVGMFCDII